jgi:hypothetical protein
MGNEYLCQNHMPGNGYFLNGQLWPVFYRAPFSSDITV